MGNKGRGLRVEGQLLKERRFGATRIDTYVRRRYAPGSLMKNWDWDRDLKCAMAALAAFLETILELIEGRRGGIESCTVLVRRQVPGSHLPAATY